MKILYRGESPTYIGECECGTIIRAKKGEVDFFMYVVRCPDCGDSITVYEDRTEMAKGIRKGYQDKQKEDNRRNAYNFWDNLAETKEEKDLEIKFDQLKQVLKGYADKENYYYQDHTSCTYEDAERGLLLLEELKNSLT